MQHLARLHLHVSTIARPRRASSRKGGPRARSSPIGEVGDCTGSVVKEDTSTVNAAIEGSFIYRYGGIQELKAASIEHQIAKIVMAISPSGALVIKYATHLECCRIDCYIVEAKIGVHKSAIRLRDQQTIISGEHGIRTCNQLRIRSHPDQPLANPFRRHRPTRLERQPTGNVRCANARMLVSEDRSQSCACLLR